MTITGSSILQRDPGATVVVAPYGPRGPIVSGTSSSAVAIGLGDVVFEMNEYGLSFLPGIRLRATALGAADQWVEGVTTDYTDNVLKLTLDLFSGDGIYDDWQINVAGEPGVQGPIGPIGATGQVPEAPQDSKTYARSMAAWVDITANFALKAPVLNPVFTGNPQAPTPAPGDNDTSIATTAFVANVAAGLQPLDADLTALAAITGTNAFYYRSAANVWTPVTIGSGISWVGGVISAASGGGNVSNSGTPAPNQIAQWINNQQIKGVDAPVFIGTPTAPTAASGDNSTLLATTGFTANNGVRNDIVQALTAAKQTQARQNIFAAPYDSLAYSGMQVNGSADVSQELGFGSNWQTIPNRYISDGWVLGFNGAFTVSALVGSATPGPDGISNMIQATATTLPTLAAGDYALVYGIIEGYRIARLAWGTANAQPITIGFWSRHTAIGVYSVCVTNATGGRSYATTYSHAVAETLQYNVVTIPGDTAGVWNNTNGVGMRIYFAMGSGSTYTAPLANTWYGQAYVAAPGQINVAAVANRFIRITGLIVLPGIEAPSAARSPFIMRPYDQELLTCRRYYQWNGGRALAACFVFFNSANCIGIYNFTPSMRSAPSCTMYDQNGTPGQGTNVGGGAVHVTHAIQVTKDGFSAIGSTYADFTTSVGCDVEADARF